MDSKGFFKKGLLVKKLYTKRRFPEKGILNMKTVFQKLIFTKGKFLLVLA